jgi:PAS domain S-box-containing protein
MTKQPISNRLAFYGAWASVAIGSVVLAGWWMNIPSFRQLFLASGEVKANTGLLFILFGAAMLWQPEIPRGTGWKRSWISIGLGCAVAWLTLLEFWTGITFGIDELLIPDWTSGDGREPGRMSDKSALGFSLVGVALIVLQGHARSSWRPMFAGLVSCLHASLAAFAVTGWFLELPTSFPIEAVGPMSLPAGGGHSVLALSLMALALRRSHRGVDVEVRWLPFALAIGVMTLACMLWLGIRLAERNQIRAMVRRAAINVEQLVSAEVQARVLTLVRVARRWENRGRRLKTDWDFDARLYLSHYPDMEAIEWVDPGFVVRWVTPEQGNESYLDLNLGRDERRQSLMTRARDAGDVTVSRVVDLESGQKGFMVFVPITEREEFGGFVVGVFRVDPLLRGLLTEVTAGFHLLFGEEGETFFSSSRVEEEVVFWEREGSVQLPASQWELTVWPRKDTLEELRSPLGLAALGGGGVLSLLLGLSVYLAQVARQKEREMSAVNRNLGDEVEERRQIQDALKESQRRLQAIMDNTSAVIYLKDEEGRYRLVNKQFETLFHLNKDDMIGRTDYDVFPKQMADSFRSNDQRALDMNEPLTIEEIAPHDDGLHTYISIKFPLVDSEGRSAGVCGISTDITDRKVAEAKLRDSHQALELSHDRLSGILEGTRDRIVALDLKYRFLSFNSSFKEDFEKRYGITIRSGQRVADVLSARPDELERLFDQWMRAMRGEEFEIEEHLNLDGSENRYVEHRFSPIRSESGVLIGATQVSREITERRRSEVERNELLVELANRNDQLIAANKELEAFSYTVSHDLRAPIRHIDGFVKLLERFSGPTMNDKGRRYLGLITDSAKRMGMLIDDLLAFSRMGRTEMKLNTVDMDRLLVEVRRALQPELEGRKIEWEVENLEKVQADAGLIRQVWMNLVSNAVKYSRTREQAMISIGCDTGHKHEVRFFVKDNGVGFDMKYVDRLFGVFQRLHTESEFDGTGIGLATVRRIVNRHGGRTWAEGKKEEGAIFWFSMPRLSGALPVSETKGEMVSPARDSST